ncbi:protein CREBRF homolog [Watersipora subatra]|uniref:protein CREBRF homolog n=1 Tax=Watersipora subatra TaxID=2589382 RepID=UPI00355C2764
MASQKPSLTYPVGERSISKEEPHDHEEIQQANTSRINAEKSKATLTESPPPAALLAEQSETSMRMKEIPESIQTAEELPALITLSDQTEVKHRKRLHSDTANSPTLVDVSEENEVTTIQNDAFTEPVTKMVKVSHSPESMPPQESSHDASPQSFRELKDKILSPSRISLSSESSLALESTSSEVDETDEDRLEVDLRSGAATPIAYDENPLVLNLSESSRDSQNAEDQLGEESIPSTIAAVDEGDQPAAGPTGQWWEYGSQSKGPKRMQFDIRVPVESSHQRLHFEDPASQTSIYPNISHAGRMRLGEGNDITPDAPLLKSLREKIKSTKEKLDKWSTSSHSSSPKPVISSRLSRLRRRANHEANKIIFAGITTEREALLGVIQKVQSLMETQQDTPIQLLEYFNSLRQKLPTPVAGVKVDYIDKVLANLDEESEESD